MMYNLQLETFICAVECKSFSKAAEKLYITSPAVIKQINSLENSLDLKRFERTHRGLIVTGGGANTSIFSETSCGKIIRRYTPVRGCKESNWRDITKGSYCLKQR